MSNEIEKLQAVQAALQPAPPALQIRETVAGIKARVQMVQHVMRDVMKPGVHYGQIPGTPKPTLYKPGAELIALAFQFAPRYVVDDLSTGDSVRYRITCELYSRDMGAFIGSGQGEASSDEEKYRWRKAVCKEEWDETPEDRRRTKWAKGRGGSVYSVQQVRTEPADLANTVLKMAEKRAFVDAIRTTTGCSDMFAQDLEDLPAEVRDGMVEDGKPVVEHLGKESWQKLVMEAAALGYSEQEVIASAATAGHEGPPEEMPRELAERLFRAMRSMSKEGQPRNAGQEAGDGDEDAKTATESSEASEAATGPSEADSDDAADEEFLAATKEEFPAGWDKTKATKAQLNMVSVLLKKSGLPEAEWRGYMKSVTGKTSRSDLTKAEASAFIDFLSESGGGAKEKP